MRSGKSRMTLKVKVSQLCFGIIDYLIRKVGYWYFLSPGGSAFQALQAVVEGAYVYGYLVTDLAVKFDKNRYVWHLVAPF